MAFSCLWSSPDAAAGSVPNGRTVWVGAIGRQGEELSAKRQSINLSFAGLEYRITVFRRGLGSVWFRAPTIADLPTMPSSTTLTELSSSLCLPV